MAIRNGDPIQLGPWTGGVRYDKPTEDLEITELASMTNTRIGAAGQVEARPGSASYSSAAAEVGTLVGTGQFVDASNNEHVWMVTNAVFNKYDSGWSDITGGLTISTTAKIEWVVGNGVLYCVNGANACWKWTGTGNIATFTMPGSVTYANHVAFWDNRLWLGGTNLASDVVHRSESAGYETWEGTYNVGGPVTALVPQDNTLTIHTEQGIWTLTSTGIANTPYSIQQVTQQGGIGGRCTVVIPDGKQMTVRKDGIYAWGGSEALERMSGALDDGYWDDLNTDELSNVIALYYPRESEVWFFVPKGGTSQTINNEVIIYSFRHRGEDDTGIWFGPYNGWDINCAALIDDKPHGGDDNGYLLDLAVGNADIDVGAGTATADYTKAFQTGGHTDDDSVKKRWLYARAYFDDKGSWSVSCQQESAGLIGAAQTLSMGSTAGQLDSFVLDTDVLGSGSNNKPAVVYGDIDLQGYDAHSSINVSNGNANEPYTFRHWHLISKNIGMKRKRKIGVEL